ncbi:MAG: hypothetical protein U1E17_06140 [Geminicoccaceae bacterium]
MCCLGRGRARPGGGHAAACLLRETGLDRCADRGVAQNSSTTQASQQGAGWPGSGAHPPG